MLAREPASFWRENAAVVVMLLRVLSKCSDGSKESNVESFIILQQKHASVLQAADENIRVNFYGEKR